MKFGVGTKSERKIAVVRTVLSDIHEIKPVTILPYAAKSKVPETPWDKQTKDGARNRAYDTQEFVIADYYIGLESGLVERYGDVYEEAWACIMTPTKKEYFGYSSGLKVPDYITNEMRKRNKAHFEIMDILDQQEGRGDNDDTWGTYSAHMIVRDISLAESLRNALVQIFAPKDSYYHKK